MPLSSAHKKIEIPSCPHVVEISHCPCPMKPFVLTSYCRDVSLSSSPQDRDGSLSSIRSAASCPRRKVLTRAPWDGREPWPCSAWEEASLPLLTQRRKGTLPRVKDEYVDTFCFYICFNSYFAYSISVSFLLVIPFSFYLIIFLMLLLLCFHFIFHLPFLLFP